MSISVTSTLTVAEAVAQYMSNFRSDYLDTVAMSRETIAAAAVEVVADGCMAIYVKAVTSQAVGEDHLRMVVRDHLYKRRRG